jgi:hypothetical protein
MTGRSITWIFGNSEAVIITLAISRNQHLALWSFYDLYLTYILICRNQHLALCRLSDLSRFYKENYEAGRIKPFNRSTISQYQAHFCAVDTDVSKVNLGKTTGSALVHMHYMYCFPMLESLKKGLYDVADY